MDGNSNNDEITVLDVSKYLSITQMLTDTGSRYSVSWTWQIALLIWFCVDVWSRWWWQSHQTVPCGWLPLWPTVALWEWSTVFGRSQVVTEYGMTFLSSVYLWILNSTQSICSIFVKKEKKKVENCRNRTRQTWRDVLVHDSQTRLVTFTPAIEMFSILHAVHNLYNCFSFFVPSCIFVSNLNESSEAPSLQPGHSSIQSVLEGDLVMNVFRDGRWGTFRHQLISQGIKIPKLDSCGSVPVVQRDWNPWKNKLWAVTGPPQIHLFGVSKQ